MVGYISTLFVKYIEKSSKCRYLHAMTKNLGYLGEKGSIYVLARIVLLCINIFGHFLGYF